MRGNLGKWLFYFHTSRSDGCEGSEWQKKDPVPHSGSVTPCCILSSQCNQQCTSAPVSLDKME